MDGHEDGRRRRGRTEDDDGHDWTQLDGQRTDDGDRTDDDDGTDDGTDGRIEDDDGDDGTDTTGRTDDLYSSKV